jgi:hypothetical protein
VTLGIPAIHLSEKQRERLRQAGLSVRQINALEEGALPLGVLFLRPPLRTSAVRDKLPGILRKVQSSKKSLQDYWTCQKKPTTPEHDAALMLLCDVAIRLFNHKAIEEPITSKRLASILQFVERQPVAQARHLAANPRPVQLIWQAIIENSEPGGNHIWPTRAPGTPFYQIVEVCYEAMGRKSPERAIRAFVEETKAREQEQRKELEIDRGALRGRGRPRKMGRQGASIRR